MVFRDRPQQVDRETAVTRRPGSGRIRRQAPGLVLLADFDRSLRLLDDAQLDPPLKAVAEEGPATGTRPPELFARTGAAGGKARATKTGADEIESSKQGRRRNAGTGATDSRRLPDRPQPSRDRAGIPDLAVDRSTCYHRHRARAPQDGTIDCPLPRAGRHALEFESARFRCYDGSGYPQGWPSAEIGAVPRVWAAMWALSS